MALSSATPQNWVSGAKATEHNAFRSLPQGGPRVANRGILNRIAAADRGKEFFDGARENGYGGLQDDGRWAAVAKDIVADYRLTRGARVLQIQCEKGFLLRELQALGCAAMGYDTSEYAVHACPAEVKVFHGSPHMPFARYLDTWFDLVIHAGVYTGSLPEVLHTLRQVQRVGKQAFVTLAAWETVEDLMLLRSWSLLGSTFLTRPEWLEVMAAAGYTGDYTFVTAKSLGLKWA